MQLLRELRTGVGCWDLLWLSECEATAFEETRPFLLHACSGLIASGVYRCYQIFQDVGAYLAHNAVTVR